MPTDPATTTPLRFAYWVPNVSGGLVTSTIEQRTDWSYDYNVTDLHVPEARTFELFTTTPLRGASPSPTI